MEAKLHTNRPVPARDSVKCDMGAMTATPHPSAKVTKPVIREPVRLWRKESGAGADTLAQLHACNAFAEVELNCAHHDNWTPVTSRRGP